ncbi:30S ribosomal protein S18 [bioreactor metagenome]|uniref:30S ribosomal protein S18 n=1 Tax=bioreactor metagenome TaxID=1076179 RepID=A0A644UAC7_9ZZZZ|nr:30S ribosomal protein S18 [Candidatus Elulimicrobiales bacterium]
MKNKKQDYFKENNIKIDYKSIDILQKFVNPNGRILNRKKTNLSSKNQRLLANAIKRARFMGLMPYVAR